MELGVKRTQRDHTLAFKLSVVDQVEKAHVQAGSAALQHPGPFDLVGTEAHAAKADARDLEARLSQTCVVHGGNSSGATGPAISDDQSRSEA